MNKIITLLIIPFLSFGQYYSGPESIEYYLETDSYFISNSNNGQILELDANNNLSIFASNIGAGPYGLEIMDNILYACSGGNLIGFDLNNGSQLLNYDLNASFLNGITQKDNILYITDFSGKKLYKYIVEEGYHTEVTSFNKNPNGTYWDSINNRLIVIFWGNNAPIFSINPENGQYNTIINTGLGYLDGITMDECGNFYISAWSSNAIHKYSSDFSETEIVANNMSNPADIFYNQFNSIIAVPNSGNNTINFISYSCDNSNVHKIYLHKKPINKLDILGRETIKKGFQLHIYNNGSMEKKYLIK